MIEIISYYSLARVGETNHGVQSSPYPKLVFFCAGTLVMLLENAIVVQENVYCDIVIVYDVVCLNTEMNRRTKLKGPSYI